jgi:hypothetical protein
MDIEDRPSTLKVNTQNKSLHPNANGFLQTILPILILNKTSFLCILYMGVGVFCFSDYGSIFEGWRDPCVELARHNNFVTTARNERWKTVELEN